MFGGFESRMRRISAWEGRWEGVNRVGCVEGLA